MYRTTKENIRPDDLETGDQTRNLGVVLLPASMDGQVTEFGQTLRGTSADHEGGVSHQRHQTKESTFQTASCSCRKLKPCRGMTPQS